MSPPQSYRRQSLLKRRFQLPESWARHGDVTGDRELDQPLDKWTLRPVLSPPLAQDKVLLRRYLRGDCEALATLIERHKTSIYTYIYHRLGSALAADEIALDVFLTMAREARATHEGVSVRVQLFQIARKICRSHPTPLSKRSRDSNGEPGILAHLVGDELDVFLLKEVALLTFSEIGKALSLRETAVKLLLQSGIRRLHTTLRGLDEYERSLRNFRAL